MRRFTKAFSWPLLNLAWYQVNSLPFYRDGGMELGIVWWSEICVYFSKALVLFADCQPCFRPGALPLFV